VADCPGGPFPAAGRRLWEFRTARTHPRLIEDGALAPVYVSPLALMIVG